MSNLYVAGTKIADYAFGKFGNRMEKFLKDGVLKSVISVSKEHPVQKNFGLYRIVKEHDAAGKLKQIQLGFSSPNPLSMDCVRLDSKKHSIKEIMGDLVKLNKSGASSETVVKYLDIWFS